MLNYVLLNYFKNYVLFNYFLKILRKANSLNTIFFLIFIIFVPNINAAHLRQFPIFSDSETHFLSLKSCEIKCGFSIIINDGSIDR